MAVRVLGFRRRVGGVHGGPDARRMSTLDLAETARTLLDLQTVGRLLGLSPRTLRRRIAAGELVAVNVGTAQRRELRISQAELDAYLARRRT